MNNAWLINGHVKDGPTGQSEGIEEFKMSLKMAGKENIHN